MYRLVILHEDLDISSPFSLEFPLDNFHPVIPHTVPQRNLPQPNKPAGHLPQNNLNKCQLSSQPMGYLLYIQICQRVLIKAIRTPPGAVRVPSVSLGGLDSMQDCHDTISSRRSSCRYRWKTGGVNVQKATKNTLLNGVIINKQIKIITVCLMFNEYVIQLATAYTHKRHT